jgi:hypothetical protein
MLDVAVAHEEYYSVLPEFQAAADPDAIMVADFEINSSALKPATRKLVSRLAGTYKSTDTLEFVGFSDCVGLESRNATLRKDRARAVAGLFPVSGKIVGAAPFPTYPPTGQYLASNTSATGRALNRSVVIRHEKTAPPPKPVKPPEPPHVNIKMEEPNTIGCSTEARRQLSIAFPAARLMAQKALAAIANNGGVHDNEILKYLLRRYFANDALLHLKEIRAGYARILNNWSKWESRFQCNLATEGTCEESGVLAYVHRERHIFSSDTHEGPVHICPPSFNKPWDMQELSATVLHELSHYLDNTEDHDTYCSADGCKDSSGQRPTTEESIDIADCYSEFAKVYFNTTM